ncbi:MAG: hypothetical protein IPN74_20115 [Haliscomenobacter sp.]|nr:hypothetical protein [Haliscomenobacter sp.]
MGLMAAFDLSAPTASDPIDFTGRPAGVYTVAVGRVTDNWVEGNPGSGGCVDVFDRSVTFTIQGKPKFRRED